MQTVITGSGCSARSQKMGLTVKKLIPVFYVCFMSQAVFSVFVLVDSLGTKFTTKGVNIVTVCLYFPLSLVHNSEQNML